MIIGSSMTQKAFDVTQQGFGISISDWYTRLADVIIRGQSGYNSRWTLMILHEIIGNYTPDMTAVFLGNNDSSIGRQFVKVEEFEANMIEIVCRLRDVNPEMAIILITPTRANKQGRSNEVTEKYADVVRSIGETMPYRMAVLDTWIGDYSITADDLYDGLHLGVTGNEKIASGIKETIRLNFPEYVPFYDNKYKI